MSILTLFPAPPCGVLFIFNDPASVSHIHPWKSQFKYLISASISWNFSVILRFALSNYITLLNVAVKMVCCCCCCWLRNGLSCISSTEKMQQLPIPVGLFEVLDSAFSGGCSQAGFKPQ